MARRLVGDPLPQVRLHLHAFQQVAVGLDGTGEATARGPALLRVAAQRLLRHAALARHLQPPREHCLGILDHAPQQFVVGVHPQLAAGLLADHRRLPAVVGVRVRADDETDVLQAQIAHRQRALELLQRVRLVHPCVEQHEAAVARHRPGVAVRHPRPRQRQTQAIQARQHALAAAELAPARERLASARHICHPAQTRLRPLGGRPGLTRRRG